MDATTTATTDPGSMLHNNVDVTAKTKNDSYNVFRDSLLRYLGYANEVGESFRYQFPKLVRPSYVVAFGYCGMDALSTGYRVWNQQQQSPTTTPSKPNKQQQAIVAETFDTLVWQSLASVMIPGAIINILVKASRRAVSRSPITLPVILSKWLPTSVGLGSIPLIIHPIDNAVDYAMDNSIRMVLFDQEEKEKEI